MYGYTEELEEITDQEATEKDRYFMEEITNGNIIRD